MKVGRILSLLLLVGALLAAGLLFSRRGNSAPARNVIIIGIDTLGAEHVGAYSPGLTTTPNLDKLADNGALMQQAFSTAPWTKPSFASLFTGNMPSRHGVIQLNDILADTAETLAERLRSAGFQTGGFVSHVFLNRKSGISQGFDTYRVVSFKGNVHDAVTSHKVTDAGMKWISDAAAKEDPFFLFLHYFDPHYNYQHHEQFSRTSNYKGTLEPGLNIRVLRDRIPTLTKEDIQYLIDLYHEEIEYTDHHIGRLLEHVRSLGLEDDTLVVVMADHGEEFMRHGWLGHTRTLYDELIKIPLIFSLPGKVREQSVSTPVSLIDIAPTVLDLLGVSRSAQSFDGLSLAACLLEGECDLPRDRLFAEVDFKSSNIDAHKSAVITDPHKLILDLPTQSRELYDREQDPEELKNLAETESGTLRELDEKLDEYLRRDKSKPVQGALEHTPEEVEQLKSLGYM